LLIIIAAIPLVLYQVNKQQFFKQFAWDVSQTAESVCVLDDETASIQLSFTNNESEHDLRVRATDFQTGKTIDLGVVEHGDTATGQIDTGLKTIEDGFVNFYTSPVDGSRDEEAYKTDYTGIDKCEPQKAYFCPADQPVNQAYCRWDLEEGATGYEVTIKEVGTDKIIKQETLEHPASQSAFLFYPDKTYQCTVKAVNPCGTSDGTDSNETRCPLPTPTPGPYCPAEPDNEARCAWDNLSGAEEYVVNVVELETGETVKTETVKYPTNSLVFPRTSGRTYVCHVTASNACGTGEESESPPEKCDTPTPSPTSPVTPGPTVPGETPTVTYPPGVNSPTPTRGPTPTYVPIPSLSPTPTLTPGPTNTPVPTPTNIPTATPRPTNTPMPTNTPAPTFTPQPTYTPAPTYTPQPTWTPAPQQQSGRTNSQQYSTQNTPIPSIAATGIFDNTIVVGIVSIIITAIGALLFML